MMTHMNKNLVDKCYEDLNEVGPTHVIEKWQTLVVIDDRILNRGIFVISRLWKGVAYHKGD
jgi:hypothetical protein